MIFDLTTMILASLCSSVAGAVIYAVAIRFIKGEQPYEAKIDAAMDPLLAHLAEQSKVMAKIVAYLQSTPNWNLAAPAPSPAPQPVVAVPPPAATPAAGAGSPVVPSPVPLPLPPQPIVGPTQSAANPGFVPVVEPSAPLSGALQDQLIAAETGRPYQGLSGTALYHAWVAAMAATGQYGVGDIAGYWQAYGANGGKYALRLRDPNAAV